MLVSGFNPLSGEGSVLSDISDRAIYNHATREHALPETPSRSSNDAVPLVSECLTQIIEKPARAAGVVLSIYGAAGEGKSKVVRRLYDDFVKSGNKSVTNVLVDFYDCAGRKEECLKQIKDSLLKVGVLCPLYTLASYRLTHGIGTNEFYAALVKDCEDVGFLAGGTRSALGIKVGVDALSAYLNLAGMIPVLGAVQATAKLFEHCVAVGKAASIRDSIEDEWDAMCRRDKRTLKDKLDKYLLEDLMAAQNHRDRKLVILVDTFEHAWQRGVDDPKRFVWMESLTKVEDTVWVISGRQSVRWSNVIQYPLELVDFTEEESIAYLTQGGIEDEEIARGLHRVTKGIPLFLEMCVDMSARLVRMQPGRLTLADLVDGASSQTEVLERYLSVLDDVLRKCAYVAAYLREWDLGELSEVLALSAGVDHFVAKAGAHDFTHVSFVQSMNGGYKVHEAAGELIRDIPTYERETLDTCSRMYTALQEMVVRVENDTELRQSERDVRVLKYHRAMVDLADRLPHVRDRDELIELGEGYIRELRSAGKTVEAWKRADRLVTSCKDLVGTSRYGMLLLLLASVKSDQFRATGQFSYHEDALRIERRALKTAQDADDEGLIVRARNAVGVSLGRFDRKTRSERDFLEELGFLEPNYLASQQIALENRTRWDANYLANYGAACQHYAIDWLEQKGRTDERNEYLCRAKDAYRESADTRMRLLKNAEGTLSVLTNLGVVLYHLGELDEAKKVLCDVDARLTDEGYAEDNATKLRNDYHRAILLELQGGELEGDQRETLIREALELHSRVLHDREYALGSDAIDTQKSKEAVNRCESVLGME